MSLFWISKVHTDAHRVRQFLRRVNNGWRQLLELRDVQTRTQTERLQDCILVRHVNLVNLALGARGHGETGKQQVRAGTKERGNSWFGLKTCGSSCMGLSTTDARLKLTLPLTSTSVIVRHGRLDQFRAHCHSVTILKQTQNSYSCHTTTTTSTSTTSLPAAETDHAMHAPRQTLNKITETSLAHVFKRPCLWPQPRVAHLHTAWQSTAMAATAAALLRDMAQV